LGIGNRELGIGDLQVSSGKVRSAHPTELVDASRSI